MQHSPRSGLSLTVLAVIIHAGLVQSGAQAADLFENVRSRMVDKEIVDAGVKNERVIAVMRTVPRHEFIPVEQREFAYFDMALPIGEKQTISPPFVVAMMTASIDPQPTDKVLEIGTGSGYQASVLSGLVKDVYTIEIVESLGRRAAETIHRLGYANVHTRIGDGYKGWPEAAPFDKIMVTCSPENIPKPLVEQLAEGGKMVIPLGERYQQTLYLYRKVQGKLVAQALEPTMFVPMTGTAEDLRKVRPDPTKPAIINGGFEQAAPGSDLPVAWYYVRQAHVAADPVKPGNKCMLFANRSGGRNCQCLQAFGIDGREVRELDVSLRIWAKDVRQGPFPNEKMKFLIVFFDDNRAPILQDELGPWTGSFDWTAKQAHLPVPAAARLAVVAIGLLGATGEAAFDDIEVKPIAVNPTALPPK